MQYLYNLNSTLNDLDPTEENTITQMKKIYE